MRVQEKTRRIDVTVQGAGLEELKKALVKILPHAIFIDDDDEAVEWAATELANSIRTERTPGLALQA
ncbi:MAG: hypothetical protein LBF60_03900 [Treponema sp.]|jgi:hypothetical protein|nr:hypothetical protein [Treponema sp.]